MDEPSTGDLLGLLQNYWIVDLHGDHRGWTVVITLRSSGETYKYSDQSLHKAVRLAWAGAPPAPASWR